MINRRHIRLKVMQSLYAFFSSRQNNINDARSMMIKHINDIYNLHISLISLIVELKVFADEFLDSSKDKYFPSEMDLNPNKRFVKNKIIELIVKDSNLFEKVKLNIWKGSDHDILRKLFLNIFKSKEYIDYINSSQKEFETDKLFLINILNEYILNNELVHHILEEESIYWPDDLPFVSSILIAQINSLAKNGRISDLGNVFKNKEDASFADDLFEKTINQNDLYNKYIQKNVLNWDLDRIALMDQLLIKMAFSEILFMEELPINVTINEYLEISKYYSTKNSKNFINGVLDNAIKQFRSDGKICKKGRGLN